MNIKVEERVSLRMASTILAWKLSELELLSLKAEFIKSKNFIWGMVTFEELMIIDGR